jgi:DNA invertase Pin-like site-specific DNA recombinase
MASAPPGFVRSHLCENPLCSEATHIVYEPQSDNLRYAARDGRRWGAIRPGEDHARAVLSDEQVATIRGLVLEDGLSQSEVARRLSLDQSHVSRIVRGERRAVAHL